MNAMFEEKKVTITKIDELEHKGFIIKPLVGVLIYKHVNQIGQKPNSRSFSGIVSLPSGKYGMYGGSSLSVFNDLRTLEPDNMEWKMLLFDKRRVEFEGRFAHAAGGFGNFLVAFGGNGPYIQQIKHYTVYNDLVVFDLTDGDYMATEGTNAAFEELKEPINLAAYSSPTRGTKPEYLMRLYRASQSYTARPNLKSWAEVRQASSIHAPK